MISGIITDHGNSSYTLEMKFVDVGEYTLEVVVTFSLSMEYDEFPAAAAPSSTSIDDGSTASEPGYEGYMVSNFPLQILVVESPTASSSSSSTAMAIIEDDVHVGIGLDDLASKRPTVLRFDQDVDTDEMSQEGGESGFPCGRFR